MNSRLTPFVQKLLIINVAFFVLKFILAGTLNLDQILALHGIYSGGFQAYQFVSFMFMHADFMHLLGNMFGLFAFGPLLEHFLGYKKFLILYFVCGIGSGLLSWGINAYEANGVRKDASEYVQNPNPDALNVFLNTHYKQAYNDARVEKILDDYSENPESEELIEQGKQITYEISVFQSHYVLLGASGAIFGILMAFALLFPNTELMLLFFPVPIKAKYLIGAYAAYEVYSLYVQRPNDNVAHFAHLTGMVFAFLLIRYWKTNRNSFY